MPDILIECADCGRRFTWSVGEQHFYRERGLSRPRRCKACRERQKQDRELNGVAAAEIPPQPDIMDPARGSVAAQKSRLKALAKAFDDRPRPWWTTAYFRFGLLVLAILGMSVFWLNRSTSLQPMVAWLLAINLLALFMYRYDKFSAGRQQARIPEVILLGLALLGGSPAAFVAMYSFRQRHKTQSSGFLLGYWSIVAVQILALIFYFSL
jgi:uncharacterized membrane protein YsdA (DUF1294 family)